MFSKSRGWLPKKFILRLTVLNTIVVTTFILVTSWSIYNTACFLVEGMTMEGQKQDQFKSTLFEYLLFFSFFAVVIGSTLHFYLTRKLIRPLRELIQSTQRIKEGFYPNPIQAHTSDEMGQFIDHFNQLVQQLKINQQQRHRIISDLSHEFRTPLSNLNGYLSALKAGVIEGEPKLYQSLLEESKRLTTMIEQIEQLKEWDGESNYPLFERESVNMKELIQQSQSVEMFRWLLKEEGIGYVVQAKSLNADVSIGGITQVIRNLVDNSIRYYKGNDPITVKGEYLDQVYKISITGEGQPIPLTDQESIFDRFYRVDNSRSRKSGGSGLGLAISKEIVEKHNGKIGLSSNGDIHSFWFTIPIYK